MPQTILIVDYEKNILSTLSRALELEGYATDTAATARAAIDKLAERPVDLVLLDVKLPDGDGLEVLSHVAQAHEGLPVVMMSGHGTIETAVKATKLGAWDFIEKPLSMDKISIVISNILSYQQEKEENLRRAYNYIYDELGPEILTKWCEEFPARFQFKL